ncbi:MAG: polysaccharide deacetylase family protein [Actinobacteria bacterium]|nr:polysaccharide deacetylase family protein [Actinomycetota bacterium]MBU1942406.1 polysaccharide deacetylase family protein [Actinomycetota bacterium]MBU2686278.1 polysaccharide deacetylase family protein [Actinomycetota bacterium]
MIVHRDKVQKLGALLIVLSLAMAGVQLAWRITPRQVVRPASVVKAHSAAADAERTGPPPEVEVRGLSYQPPTGKATGVAGGPAAMREAGTLKGYSVPPDRLAFEPDGSAVFLPTPPPVGGRVAARTVRSGSDAAEASRRVALTFDSSDVSEPAARAVIDELTRLRAPATFFVCGRWCERNPELCRLASERGFEMANHSYAHPDFRTLTNEQITAELKRTEQAYTALTGETMAAYFRPPYGSTDARVQQVAADNGYTVAMWSRDTRDWSGAAREQIRDVASGALAGSEIIIMHMNAPHTVEALAEIVTNLRAGGFELTTLSGVLLP